MAARKAPSPDQIFTVEVEPGLFVYSLSGKLPAASRKMVDKMVAEGDERSHEAAREIREIIAAQRNGHSSA